MFCSYCGKDLPDDAEFCSKCGKAVLKSIVHENFSQEAGIIGKTCPFCQYPIKSTEEVIVCPLCGAPHHKKCWIMNDNKCTTWGCAHQRQSADIPSNEITPKADESNGDSKLGATKIFCKPRNRLIAIIAALSIVAVFFVYNAMNGEKTIAWADSNNPIKGVYQGTVRWNVPHGKGKIVAESGNFYEGEFQSGLFSGQGKFVSTWVNQKKEMHFKSQTDYSGSWKNGKQEGKGVETEWFWVSKSPSFNESPTLIHKYTGQFEKGIKKGHGKLQTSDTNYEGEWDEERNYARVNYTATDGTQYSGEIDMLLFSPEGQGTMLYPDGARYSGHWKLGERDGHGTFTFYDGTKVVGQWKKGVPSDDGSHRYKIYLRSGMETTGSCWATGDGGFACSWSL